MYVRFYSFGPLHVVPSHVVPAGLWLLVSCFEVQLCTAGSVITQHTPAQNGVCGEGKRPARNIRDTKQRTLKRNA